MKVIIDRFEGPNAVVETEDKRRVTLPGALVPPGAAAGSVLSIALEPHGQKKRKDETAARIEALWKD